MSPTDLATGSATGLQPSQAAGGLRELSFEEGGVWWGGGQTPGQLSGGLTHRNDKMLLRRRRRPRHLGPSTWGQLRLLERLTHDTNRAAHIPTPFSRHHSCGEVFSVLYLRHIVHKVVDLGDVWAVIARGGGHGLSGLTGSWTPSLGGLLMISSRA